MQKNAKKMPNYLHISKKSSIFAADLGIVPSTTIKYNRVMTRKCVFRIEIEGSLWRVTEENHPHVTDMYVYRIMHQRRCYGRVEDWNARPAIIRAMELAFRCHVAIHWKELL